LVLAIVMCAYGIFEILDHCAQVRCGRWMNTKRPLT
jgi:hypothetical protein